MVKEDRKREGIVKKMKVGKKMQIERIEEMKRGILKQRKREKRIVDKQIRNVKIKKDGGEEEIGQIQGGNKKKVVIGKMMEKEKDVIMIDEKRRGIEIGEKEEVLKIMEEKEKKGMEVV